MYFIRASLVFVSLTFGAVSGCASAPPGTIGATLGQRTDHRLFVRSAPPGEGADRAGLGEDDEILAIDGRDVHVMTEEEIRSAVRGPVGSTLVVTVRRGDEKRDVTVVRSPIKR
jgi:carboxyl-terminal processing protease